MKKTLLLIFITITLNAQIYVSITGNDVLGDGSFNNPIRTISKAFDLVKADADTIYLFGGIFEESKTLKPFISGTASSYKCLFSVPGERPVIDFSGQEYSSSNRGIKLSEDYWHLKGLEIRNAGDNGIHISGHYNKVENTLLHHNKDTGLQISNGGSYNRIINCDSYLNYDPNSHGENADGFAPKLDIGPGNYFKNCRAYFNSDDGWDCYEAQNQIIIDSCWAFHNGFNIWDDSSFEGDGNGFKLGGNYVPAPHIIRNSIAFDNKSKGFDQNHNAAGITVLNCTAYRNDKNYSFNEAPTDSIHILKNNISFSGSESINSRSIEMNNSWDDFFVTWQDFKSLDTSLARIPRDENFNIPYTDFLRLKPTSSLIDSGTDVGIAYLGSTPDLGAFEYDELFTSVDEIISGLPNKIKLEQNYPNPFNPTTTIKYSIPTKVKSERSDRESLIKLTVYDILGKTVTTIIRQNPKPGTYEFSWNANNLPSGVYYYQLLYGNYSVTKKMLLVK